jgi:hypothetical protein
VVIPESFSGSNDCEFCFRLGTEQANVDVMLMTAHWLGLSMRATDLSPASHPKSRRLRLVPTHEAVGTLDVASVIDRSTWIGAKWAAAIR